MEDVDKASEHEKAEAYFLQGKIKAIEGDYEEALHSYEKAHLAYPPGKKYFIAYLEAINCYETEVKGEVDFDKLIKAIPDTEDEDYIYMKSKYLAAKGDFEAAEKIIEPLPKEATAATRAINAFLKNDWALVVNITDEALGLANLPDWKLISLYLLNARAHFYLSIQDEAYIKGLIKVPLFGTQNMDLSELQKAWDATINVMNLLRKNGWPKSIEYLLDILGIASTVLGKIDEIYDDIKNLVNTRKSNINIISFYEQLCMAKGDIKEAYAANKTLPDTDEVVLRRIVTGYEAGYKKDVLSLANDKLLSIPDDTQGYPIALSIAIVCADELIHPEIGDKFVQKLSSKPEWEDELIVCQYFLKIHNNVLDNRGAVESLLQAYERHPNSLTLQMHLIFKLNPTELGDAEKILEIFTKLKESRGVRIEFSIVAAQAMITLQDWDELSALADELMMINQKDSKPFLLKAIALDSLGSSGSALQILERGIEITAYDNELVNSYVMIAVRCGFLDKSIELVEMLIEKEKDKKKILEKYRLLFNLVIHKDARSPRIQEIAWKYGQLVDRNNEKEEGLFIQMFMFATAGKDTKVSEERVKSVQSRTMEFVQKFPESSFLRLEHIKTDASADDLLSLLKKMSGMTEERLRWFQKVENQLHSREIQVPFSLRWPWFVRQLEG